MDQFAQVISDLANPATLSGKISIGMLFFVLASIAAALIRRFERRFERRLSDVTLLRFTSLFAQFLAYLIGFILYAHFIPELRSFGTTLLAGASVISVVVGLAAQDTLGNLIAGFSLVISRAFGVGDSIRLYCPVGVISARVKVISLGFTVLIDEDQNEVFIPNSVIMSGAIVHVSHAAADARAKA